MRVLSCVGALVGIVLASASLAGLASAQESASKPAVPQRAAPPALGRDLGTMLLDGLKETPGCMGADSARTSGGKNLIFAWFKDKKAALAWYHSETHNTAKRMFFPEETAGYVPLAGVPDDAGPLLVIASMLPPKPSADGAPGAPQFSIETLTPVTAGMTTSPEGSFSPPDFVELFKARRAAQSGE